MKLEVTFILDSSCSRDVLQRVFVDGVKIKLEPVGRSQIELQLTHNDFESTNHKTFEQIYWLVAPEIKSLIILLVIEGSKQEIFLEIGGEVSWSDSVADHISIL